MSQPEQRPAALNLEHGSIEPDRRVAELALHALAAYLHNVKAGVIEPALGVEMVSGLSAPSEPRLDSSGYWRLGVWLLEARSGALALTYRPVQPEPRYEYVAILRGDGKLLKVETLSLSTMRPRR